MRIRCKLFLQSRQVLSQLFEPIRRTQRGQPILRQKVFTQRCHRAGSFSQDRCHSDNVIFNVQKFELYIDNILSGRVTGSLWIRQSILLICHISVHDSFVDKKRFAQSTPMHRHSFEKVRLIYATNPLFSQTMDRVTGAT